MIKGWLKMKYPRLLTIILLVTAVLLSGCSVARSRKHGAGFHYVMANQTYQVRVRTGNIEMDRVVHAFASSDFRRYTTISEEGPFDGYIEITFKSELKKMFGGSSQGYAGNIKYGDAWYTGEDSGPDAGERAKAKKEIESKGLFSWQNSEMLLTFRDSAGSELWSSSYEYIGSRDVASIVFHDADSVAKVCLARIIMQFEKDFNIAPKLSTEEKKLVPEFALVVGEKKVLPEWRNAGQSKGETIYINKDKVTYPDIGIFRLPVTIVEKDKKTMELYEIDCPRRRYRILDRYSNKGMYDSPYTTAWMQVQDESSHELVYDFVCKVD